MRLRNPVAAKNHKALGPFQLLTIVDLTALTAHMTFVISSRRGWLIRRSAHYGNRSPNDGKYPPNEAAH